MAGSIDESTAEGCEPIFSSNFSGSDASLPSDLSGRDESKVVPDKMIRFQPRLSEGNFALVLIIGFRTIPGWSTA